MRSMCAAMLTLQAIVLGLSAPVLIGVEDVDVALALTWGLGLAIVCLVTAGLLRFGWAYWIGHAIQVASLLMGFVLPIMFFIGGMFAALWLGAFFLGRKIDADKARWAAEADRGEPES